MLEMSTIKKQIGGRGLGGGRGWPMRGLGTDHVILGPIIVLRKKNIGKKSLKYLPLVFQSEWMEVLDYWRLQKELVKRGHKNIY